MMRSPDLLVVLVVAGAVWAAVWAIQSGRVSGRSQQSERRAAAAIADAVWQPSHYEQDGVTHVVVRKAATLPNGEQRVLDQREFTTFRSDDPMWEGLFADAMAGARVRVDYLNAEERAP